MQRCASAGPASRTWFTHGAKLTLALVIAAGLLGWETPLAQARGRGRGRNNNAAVKRYQQAVKQQQQQFAKTLAAYEKAQKEKYDAFMKRFDSNGNGKIDGKEKAPAHKYLRELELGKNPDKLGFSAPSDSRPSFGK